MQATPCMDGGGANLELDGDDAVVAHILELAQGRLLDQAGLGGHEQIGLLLELGHRQDGGNADSLLDGQHLPTTTPPLSQGDKLHLVLNNLIALTSAEVV